MISTLRIWTCINEMLMFSLVTDQNKLRLIPGLMHVLNEILLVSRKTYSNSLSLHRKIQFTCVKKLSVVQFFRLNNVIPAKWLNYKICKAWASKYRYRGHILTVLGSLKCNNDIGISDFAWSWVYFKIKLQRFWLI